jgi:hypothetical protein
VTLVLRIGLAVFAAVELVLGTWTAFSPRSFYDTVPTVNLTPPYSEHLMRDFGLATLGIAVVLVAATIWPTTKLAIVALVAYLVFALPHLIFHTQHVGHAAAGEGVGLLIVLGASVVGPIALIGVAFGRARTPGGAPQ